MKKGDPFSRILRVWLSLTLLFPAPAVALRPMVAQRALVKELSTGLEEVPIDSAWRVFRETLGEIGFLVFSPDGQTIYTGGQEPNVFQWDVMTGRVMSRGWAHESGIREMVISPSGRRAATVDAQLIRVWDTGSGRMIHAADLATFRRRGTAYVGGLNFTPRGELVVPLTDTQYTQARVLYREDPSVQEFPEQVGMQMPAHAVVLALDVQNGRLISGGRGSELAVSDLKTGVRLGEWETRLKGVNLLAVSPAGNRVAATDSIGTVVVLNGETGVLENSFPVVSPMVQKLVFSPAGDRLAVLGSDGGIQLIDLSVSAAPDIFLEGHGGSVQDAAFSPDGFLLASAGKDGTVRLWGPSFEVTERILQAHAPNEPSWRRAAEWLGMRGGQEAVARLFDLSHQAEGAFLPRLAALTLAAGSNGAGPVPFLSGQWAQWLEWINRSEQTALLERSFWEVLAFLGPDLEAGVFESSLRKALARIWSSSEGYWIREEGPSNPKDRLAHVLIGWKLQHIIQEYHPEGMQLAEGLWRSGISYQELAKISDLLDRYPGPVSTAMVQVARQAGDQISYVSAAARGWVELDGMAPALELLGMAADLAQAISEGGLNPNPGSFSRTPEDLKRRIAHRAEEILGIHWEPFQPVPFLDERFTEPQRARFMRALLYQAEQQGEVFREVLGTYFLALQKDPSHPEKAVDAVQVLLKRKSPTFVNDAVLRGPPTRDYIVPYSARVSVDLSMLAERYSQARAGLVHLVEEGRKGEPAFPTAGIDALLETWAPVPSALSQAQDRQKTIHKTTQAFLEAVPAAQRGRFLPAIGGIRKAMHEVVSQLSARELLNRDRFVRIGVEQDPTKILHLAWPSDSCLDCQKGTHRKFTQHYVGPDHILITAEDPELSEVPFLARLTLTRTAEGALLVTNAFSEHQQSLDLFPFFVEFLQDYARWTGMPVLYPQKFLMGRKLTGWQPAQETVTLPAGIGNEFHADVAVSQFHAIEKLPLRLAKLPVYRYVPPPEPVLRPGTGISIRDLNRMVEMMSRLLVARSEGAVDAAFIQGIQEVLGFDGVALYHVRPAENEIGYEIRSGARTLEEPSRFAEWLEPRGEHREVLASGEQDLLIDRAGARSLDPEWLARFHLDQRAHSEGNADSVYYVVLRDSEDRPWGLVLVHRWKSGEPIFGTGADADAAHRREQIRKMIQVLGNGALLAYQQAQAHESLSGYLELSTIGGRLASDLEAILNLLRGLSRKADQLSRDARISELVDLAGEMKGIVEELKPQAMMVREISKTRVLNRRRSSDRAMAIEDVDALEGLLGDLSLTLLSAVVSGDPDGIERAKEEFLAPAGDPNGVDFVVREWIALAQETLGLRRQMRSENEQFVPHLRNFMIGFRRLGQIRGRLAEVARQNQLPDGLGGLLNESIQDFDALSGRLEGVIGRLNGSLVQAGESALTLQTGLEESRQRLFYHKIASDPTHLLLDDVRLWTHAPAPFMRLDRPVYIGFNHFAWPHGFRIVRHVTPVMNQANDWVRMVIPANLGSELLIQEYEDGALYSQEWVSRKNGGWESHEFKIQVTPNGVAVSPKQVQSDPYHLEWIPNEFNLSVSQWGRFAVLTESIREETEDQLVAALRSEPESSRVLWEGKGSEKGITIFRSGLMTYMNLRRKLHDDTQAGENPYGMNLVVTLAKDRWILDQLSRFLQGVELGPGESRLLPLKSSDGERVAYVSLLRNPDNGSLPVRSVLQDPTELYNTLRLFLRFVAFLTEVPRPPLYLPRDPADRLEQAIQQHQRMEGRIDSENDRHRFEASWALARHVGHRQVPFILKRLQSGSSEWEPSASIRWMMAAELIRRHEEKGGRFLPRSDRRQLWHALAGLLTGESTKYGSDQGWPLFEQDDNPQVQWVAAQGIARLTPLTDPEWTQESIRILKIGSQREHGKTEAVRDLALTLAQRLAHWQKTGQHGPWDRFLPGPPVEDLMSQTGLEERILSMGLQEWNQLQLEVSDYLEQQY